MFSEVYKRLRADCGLADLGLTIKDELDIILSREISVADEEVIKMGYKNVCNAAHLLYNKYTR